MHKEYGAVAMNLQGAVGRNHLRNRFHLAKELAETELEQAWVRIGIGVLVIGYFALSAAYDGTISASERNVVLTALGLFGLMWAQMAWIVLRPAFNPKRIYASISIDNGSTTCLLLLAQEHGIVLYGIYLWVAVGNGFRFGRRYLHLSQTAAVIGFLIVWYFDPFWQQHFMLSSALIVMIAAVPYYVAIMASRLQEMNRELKAATLSAERANKTKSKFLAAASHDLRQPMTALSFYSEALKAKLGNDRDAMKVIDGIDLSVKTLEQLFESALDISRIEAGAFSPSIVSFPLMPLLNRIVEIERILAEAKGIDIRVKRTSECVRSDPILLERVIKNMLTNAIRYTMKGRIVVGCRRRPGGKLDICIVDSGIGIPDEEQDKIFDEFYQGDGGGGQGMGLGLPIVRSLTELLGHQLHVQSKVGRGSIFSLRLDRTERAPDLPAAVTLLEPFNVAGACVVLVDDDIEIRQSMSILLKQWGCDALIGGTWADVEAMLAQRVSSPDAVIVDYRLADFLTGLDLIVRLRERYAPDLPAMLITGTANIQVLQNQIPGVAVVAKPVPPPKIRAFLYQSLAIKRLKAANS
jgi:signal transduction histidine kinase/ActR/RegA family two-component response regulator